MLDQSGFKFNITGALKRKEQTQPGKGKHHMIMEAEIRATHLQAVNLPKTANNHQALGKRQEKLLP